MSHLILFGRVAIKKTPLAIPNKAGSLHANELLFCLVFSTLSEHILEHISQLIFTLLSYLANLIGLTLFDWLALGHDLPLQGLFRLELVNYEIITPLNKWGM